MKQRSVASEDQIKGLLGKTGKTTLSNNPRKKLDTVDAANYLSLGKSTLEKLRIVGGGPAFIKIGKRVVYDPADLDAWFAAHKRTSTSECTATAA